MSSLIPRPPFSFIKPEIFEQMSHIIGSDKILFGTDYPLMHQNRVLAQIQSAQLPEEDKARILGANAQKLLCLG